MTLAYYAYHSLFQSFAMELCLHNEKTLLYLSSATEVTAEQSIDANIQDCSKIRL